MVNIGSSHTEDCHISPSCFKGDWRTRLLLTTLLITSFSSLIYEVIWGRELSFILGTSALAITTVLTTFMAGLALGSFYGGRAIDCIEKKHRFLGLIQISIGVSCLGTLYLLSLVRQPYLFIYDLLRGQILLFNSALFALSFAILIVPTFLIGMAFPTVVKLYYSELKAMGRSVGTTYMFDTLGGAAGALLTGFFLIATLGLFNVSILASMINVAFGAITILAFRETSLSKNLLIQSTEQRITQNKMVLILFFLSGFAALMFEVIWTRYIA